MSSPEQHFLSAIGYFKYIQISNILTSHWCSQFCPKPELVAPLKLSISPPRRMNSDSDSPCDTRVQNISEAFRWGSWWRDWSRRGAIKANSKPSNWRVIPYLKQDSTRFKMPEPINTHHGFQFNHTSYGGSRPSSCFTSAPAIRHPPQRWSEFAHQSGAPSRSKSSGHRRCPPELLDSASVDHDGGWVTWWGLDCISDNLLI